MKKSKFKIFKKLLSKEKKLLNFKSSIMPNKVFYIWDRNNLTKIETFSL